MSEDFVIDIESNTLNNKNYRRVIFTGKHLQVVLMSLDPGVEIGFETHKTLDQFIRVESGNGIVILGSKNNEREYELSDGDALVIPAGTKHNIICPEDKNVPLKLYTIYSRPNHPEDLIQIVKKEGRKRIKSPAKSPKSPKPKKVKSPRVKKVKSQSKSPKQQELQRG